MLAKGLEPSTVRLQGGCSTIELHQHRMGNSNTGQLLISRNLHHRIGRFFGGRFRHRGALKKKGRNFRGPLSRLRRRKRGGDNFSTELLVLLLDLTTLLKLLPRTTRTRIVSPDFMHLEPLQTHQNIAENGFSLLKTYRA
jgi:hypothetical protein